jgi:hypothetical protein
VPDPVDYKSAVGIWRDAAQQGNAEAQYQLGTMCWNGLGVTKDDGEAVQWYRHAADQGLAVAQYDLGVAYRDGRGVSKSEADFVQWNRKAADQGFPPAEHNLGVQYFNGIRGVPQDNAEAMKWLRRAADQGWVPSQGMVAVIYWQGRGTAKDPVEAYKGSRSLPRVRRVRPRPVKAGREELAKSMTRTQIDEAFRAASDWAPSGVADFRMRASLGWASSETAGRYGRCGSLRGRIPDRRRVEGQVDRSNGIVQFSSGSPKQRNSP